MTRLLILLSLAPLVACVTPPSPIPPVATCEAACANLARFGCPEADPPVVERAGCVPVCEHAVSSGSFIMDTDCMVAAGTVEEVQACNVRCKR